MRPVVLAAAGFLVLATSGPAGARPAVEWTHEGYQTLVEAAAKAKQEEQMLLIGLSGGDT